MVESINSGIGDVPYVVLKTGDAFDSVQMTFSRKYRDKALDLDKGDRIKYSCIGGSVIVGTPILRDCKPIEEEKKEIMNELRVGLNKITSGEKEIPGNALDLYKFILKLSSMDPSFLECKEYDVKCVKNKMNHLIKKNKNKDKK